ncbi:MAG: arsenic metallochaperone ArsD family protein [Enterococcaceae bacterium]|nr:arsenic metallochaperone ArsD family protein [Enterococcaceae bacterium]MCI1919013.1 arsenic metallochaperone ArsD family protein [Enterococcaceae bacterium]
MKLELFEAFDDQTGAAALDPTLNQDKWMAAAAFEALDELQQFDAKRYQAKDATNSFDNEAVKGLMAQEGTAILPIMMLDGEMVKSGSYPTIQEIGNFAGVQFVEDEGCGGSCGSSCGDSCGGSCDHC